MYTLGVFIPNLSEGCYRCLCHVSTLCQLSNECKGGYCGPFNISRVYWVDAGKVTLPDDDPDRNNGKLEIRILIQHPVLSFHSITCCNPINKCYSQWIITDKVLLNDDVKYRKINVIFSSLSSLDYNNHGFIIYLLLLAWRDCARDYYCAKKIIEGYLQRFAKVV